jgi:hypothetical protein
MIRLSVSALCQVGKLCGPLDGCLAPRDPRAPPRQARLIDATSPTGVKVPLRIGVVLGQAVLVRLGCHYTGLALEEFPDGNAAALGNEGGGGREGGRTRPLLEVQAELLERSVDLEARHWPRGKSRGDERTTRNAMERTTERETENAIENGVESRKGTVKSVKEME